MKKEVPKIIKEVGFDFHWDERKVWELDIPTEEMDISELEWHFDIPFWSTPDGYYDLKPRDVIENGEEHKQEYKRIMDSNLNYPLDVMKWKGRWLLLDGLHRLTKAKILKQEIIRVRKISEEDIPKIKNEF